MKVQKLRPLLRHVEIIVILLLFRVTFSKSEEEYNNADDFDEELYSVINSVKDGSLWAKSRQLRSVDVNRTTGNESFSDNSLWNDLWFECKRKASFSCVRTGVFKYLDRSLDRTSDLPLTDSLLFRKNKNKVNGFCENSDEEREKCLRYNKEKLKVTAGDSATEKEIDTKENEIRQNEKNNVNHEKAWTSNSTQDSEEDVTEGAADGRRVESLRDLSDILYDKGSHFLMTHDMELQLPQLFFGGGSVKIEPKSYVEGDENEEEGALVKIVFKPPFPPGQIVRGRAIHHLKKLFKKKLMHSFMALMLLIKMIKVKLMFLLPMIIGKATAKKLLLKVLLFLIPGLAHLFKLCHYYHMEHSKYHHHHHKIKHHHHHVQIPVPVPVPVDPHHHHDSGLYDKPYGLSAAGYGADYPPYPSSHHSQDGDSDYDYTAPQGPYNKDYGSHSQYIDNEAQLMSWGLGASNIHEAGVLDAKNQPNYYKNNNPYSSYHYPDSSGSHSQHYFNKAHFFTAKPPLDQYDPFYSPILKKIDAVFVQMGFMDEPCRERLVCNMYKTPQRFSPHSNLLSHELSRDARDLQKPVRSNAAVLRFYKYIQAARDGQDKKDCLRLYPSCSVTME